MDGSGECLHAQPAKMVFEKIAAEPSYPLWLLQAAATVAHYL